MSEKPVAWMTPGGDVSRSLEWCKERCWPEGAQPTPLYSQSPTEARALAVAAACFGGRWHTCLSSNQIIDARSRPNPESEEDEMMPTMQEIDAWDKYGIPNGSPDRARLYAAARRGVEAEPLHEGRITVGGLNKLMERAEKAEAECAAKDTLIADWYGRARKAEAELAALKVAQPGRHTSLDIVADRTAIAQLPREQPERVSVPREHLVHLRDDEPVKVELVRKWAAEMLDAAQEGK